MPVEKCQTPLDTADDTVTRVRRISASLMTVKDVIWMKRKKNSQIVKWIRRKIHMDDITKIIYKYLLVCLSHHTSIPPPQEEKKGRRRSLGTIGNLKAVISHLFILF